MDDFRVRRSTRRVGGPGPAGDAQQQAAQNEIQIFDLELVPDDFRPGQRNKKLDTFGVSQNGIVVAGTNTGEIFAWKVSFSEVAKRNKHDAVKFLGKSDTCCKYASVVEPRFVFHN